MNRSALWLGGLMCAMGGCAVDSQAVEEPAAEDTSVVVEPIVGGVATTAYPEAALLNMRATSGSNYACSAVLLSPHVVLSAGHCVDGMASWDVYVGGMHATSTHGETFDWHENGASTVNPIHHDVGLVYLDQPIRMAQYPVLAKAPVADGTQLIDVGRIDDGQLTSSFYRAPVSVADGRTIGYALDYYATDVIEHGDSGGPVYVPSTHTIAAVNSGANGVIEVLARVDLVEAWIAERIAAQGDDTVADPGPAGDAGSTPADAGAAIDSGSSAADAGPASGPGACAKEVEPNDTVAHADSLSGAVCGQISPATDVDWYVLPLQAGTTKVTLAATGDASLAVGYLQPNRSCALVIPSTSNVHGVTISVGRAAPAATLCLLVSSPGKHSQTYTLGAIATP